MPAMNSPSAEPEALSTLEVARRLGLAVRSVQLMVDRGELQAWRTPGGHRRISQASVDAWCAQHQAGAAGAVQPAAEPQGTQRQPALRLYIEDSRHFQNFVSLLVRQRYPDVELHLADDGFGGLALAGRLQPDVLLVDILLPGMDGATLISSLRSQPAFARSRLIVLTSLEAQDLAPYAFALQGVPVVHKPRLVHELPSVLDAALQAR
jgi:excisionase family DNA binding protein